MRLSAAEAYEKYADRVFAAAFAVCRDRADADDVTQDTFMRYIARGQQYESEEHLKAWLLRVAVNRARDLTRSLWHRSRVPWEDCMAELPFEEPADSRLFAAVMALPERYRTAIHLFYYEDWTIAQIASALHAREGTVKSWLSRGRKLLKNTLMEEWDDDE